MLSSSQKTPRQNSGYNSPNVEVNVDIDTEEEARDCRYLGLTISEVQATTTQERGMSLVGAW